MRAALSLLVLGLSACGRSSGNDAVGVTRSMLAQVSSQVELFRLDHGRLPETLRDLMTAPTPYFRSTPLDGWGREFVYRRTDAGFELLSLGADGKPGGTGADEDLRPGPR